MSVDIPVWLLWAAGLVVGVPLLALIIAAAVLGPTVIFTWKPPRR